MAEIWRLIVDGSERESRSLERRSVERGELQGWIDFVKSGKRPFSGTAWNPLRIHKSEAKLLLMGKFTSGLRILMVDDSKEDIFFVKRALDQSGVGLWFHAVEDGEEAVRYLCGTDEYADRQRYPFPNLILTDLKMPRMDGYQLLQWLRDHPECGVIPTVVLSSSSMESDVKRAYETGANAYLTKPTNLRSMIDLIRLTYQFWVSCETPPFPPEARCSHSAEQMHK